MGEIVYLARDNTFELQLIANGIPLTALQMGAISRIDLIFNGTVISSQSASQAFDWSSRASEAVVIFALGGHSLSIGTDLAADLIIYDASHPNGLFWASFTLKVAQV